MKKMVQRVLFAALTAGISMGNAGQAAADSPVAEVGTGYVAADTETAVIDDEEVPLYMKPLVGYVRTPQASNAVIYSNSRVTIDASNTDQGYVMVKYNGGAGKIKVQLIKNDLVYTYDLNARDAYEVFPFSEGDGVYTLKVYEHVSGNQYAQAFSQTLSVTMPDPFAPFLTPNQYVNFRDGSAAVQAGTDAAAGAQDQISIVTNIYNYVISNISYDLEKAATVQSGYLPDVDQVLALKKGICFDYAALMTTMLRSQDIPTKLVIGYTGGLYHAWINVYLESVGWVDSCIYFDGHSWSLMDPTFASSGGNSENIRQYIGNNANYQAKYSY